MLGRSRIPAILLALLIFCGLIWSQTMAVNADHTDCHAAKHCCGVCHLGHSPLSPPAATIGLAPPAPQTDWHHRADGQSLEHDPLLIVSPSRAPPA